MDKQTIILLAFYGILLAATMIQFFRHKKRCDIELFVMNLAMEFEKASESELAEDIESMIVSALYARYKFINLVIPRKKLLQLVDYAVETTAHSLAQAAKKL